MAEVPLYLDKNVPWNTKGDDWGSGTAWEPTLNPNDPDPSPVSTCKGRPLPCQTLDIDRNWKVKVSIKNTDYTVTIADNQHYWDSYFALYKKESDVDYSKNCHGYVADADYWINGTEMGFYLVDCNYRIASNQKEKLKATVALRNGGGHSVKGAFKSCRGGVKLVRTLEQFRESGIYRQQTDCGGPGIEVSRAHQRRKWRDQHFMWFYKSKKNR